MKYSSLRSPNSIAIATVHKNEKDHTHLHICFSGVQYKTGKSIRISKDDFQNKVKLPMEKYQQEIFPELVLSKIRHEKSMSHKKVLVKDNEKIIQNSGGISEKQGIVNQVENCFKTAKSEQEFYQKLQDSGLVLYSRGGKITGVQGKRKYRFKTLGYTVDILHQLEQNPTLINRLELLKKVKENEHERDYKK